MLAEESGGGRTFPMMVIRIVTEKDNKNGKARTLIMMLMMMVMGFMWLRRVPCRVLEEQESGTELPGWW